jgi:CRP-like cAMP-binding protein/RsiW-degrading membrane proteinase PrsW (M82 family)
VDERVGAMRDLAFFQDVPQRELEAIAARLTLRRFDQGALIVTEGDEGDACYLMRKGKAVVVSADVVGHEVRLATLGPGTVFGEMALVMAGRRSATVRALQPVEAYMLRRADFNSLESSCPAFADHVRHHIDVLSLDSFLRKASPFAHLTKDTMRRLAGQLQVRRVAKGETIIHEGETGDFFYLVREGRVEVLKGGRRVQVLASGDIFGEVALLAAVRRTATVRALTETELLTLTRSDFEALVRADRTLLAQFREFVRIRVGAAVARTIAAVDPLATLMPVNVRLHDDAEPDVAAVDPLANVSPETGPRRDRYWWLLLGGVGLFGVLSLLAVRTQERAFEYGALIAGSFVGPVVYVTYLAELHLLPERSLRLGITFMLTAVLGLPLAAYVEAVLGASAGALGPSLLVSIIEEAAKLVGVTWLVARSESRFQMDGVVYGAAAGMGFAAFENIIYGVMHTYSISTMISILWWRTLLSPFGHGTWSAIICGAIWRQKESGAARLSPLVLLATGLSVGLHTLWNWQPLTGPLLIGWFVLVGAAGLVVLNEVIKRARREILSAIAVLNPHQVQAWNGAIQVHCSGCGQLSPPGTSYCVRCGAALRR